MKHLRGKFVFCNSMAVPNKCSKRKRNTVYEMTDTTVSNTACHKLSQDIQSKLKGT